MSCALTQGFNLDCRDSIGGLKEIYLIEHGNLGDITEASGVVTAISKLAGKRFYKYSLIRETSSFDEVITVNDQHGTAYYTQTNTIVLNKRQASVRNEIMLIAKNNVATVAVDNNGKAWLFGRENGLVPGGNTGSGTAWSDRNGATLTFTGNERELAPEVSAEVLSALGTPGA